MKDNMKLAVGIWPKLFVRFFLASVINFTIFNYVPETVAFIIAQLVSAFIFYNLIYTSTWFIGTTDNNSVNFKRATYDKWKGLKIGVCIAIPYIVVWVVMISLKIIIPQASGFDPLIVNRIVHFHLYFLHDLIIGNAPWADASIWSIILFGLTNVLIPVFGVLGYHLGYKQKTIMNSIIYKKQK